MDPGKALWANCSYDSISPVLDEVSLDGHAIDDIDVHWLRDNVTLVVQHSVLYDNTIRHNIALGKPGDTISLKDVENAIKFAMLDPIIQGLPNGLDTQLGVHGSSLSGGQILRMALARVRNLDTPVLVLDESTSALDYVTRAAILQAIRD